MSTTIGFEEDMSQESRDYGREAMLRRVGALARRRREELGLSREAFVQQAGMGSTATMRDFEFGKTEPQSRTMLRIEKALGWWVGSISELLNDPRRKVSEVKMEDLDEHDAKPVSTLANIPTAQLLEEVINRLSIFQSGLGGAPVPTQDMLGLAASGGHKPEHLDDNPDDDISGLNISPN